ncbi:MAG: fluoride efflux transporter CrcB [Gammaproteobacteria bacterium]|nr:fluoride efflux transporter CrcB [Gammaproteobacteria bacterium]
MDTWLIFIGAGLGGVSRFGISNTFAWLLGRDFPYGTLVVNALGSFLIGLLFILILDRLEGIANHLRPLMLTGFLGGFTTFSTFSIETLNLLENNGWTTATLNIVLNLVLCLFMVWLGVWGGRQL